MIIMNIPASVYLDLLELYCQKFVYTILFMDKIIRMAICLVVFSKIQFTVLIMFSFTC